MSSTACLRVVPVSQQDDFKKQALQQTAFARMPNAIPEF
jgi:hypothetical protein